MTNDEDTDTPEVRTNRRENKQLWLEEVDAATGPAETRLNALYQPDQKSIQYTMSFFLHPVLKAYPSNGELSDAEKKQFMEQILLGGGMMKKGIRVAETVELYVIYLKRIMGMLQAKEIEEGRGDSLPKGRLQFWQFLSIRLLSTSAYWTWSKSSSRLRSWTSWSRGASRSTAWPPTTGW